MFVHLSIDICGAACTAQSTMLSRETLTLSTIDLLFNVACYVQKVITVFNLKAIDPN
jgi:hypothetical protein